MQKTSTVQITLTPEQQQQILNATDQKVRQVRLNVEQLEERLAPAAAGISRN
jgi:hypothetical protein